MNSSPQAVAGGDGSALRRQALGESCAAPVRASRRRWRGCRKARAAARPACGASGPAVRHQRHLVHLDRTGPRSVGVALGLVAHRRRVAAGARRTRLSVRAGRLRRSAAAARRPAARQGRCAPAWTRSARPPMCWTAPGTCWPGTSPCASCSTTGPCAIPNPICCATSSWTRPRAAGGGLGAARARGGRIPRRRRRAPGRARRAGAGGRAEPPESRVRPLVDAARGGRAGRGLREFQHPRSGQLAFQQITFRLATHPDLKLVMLLDGGERD